MEGGTVPGCTAKSCDETRDWDLPCDIDYGQEACGMFVLNTDASCCKAKALTRDVCTLLLAAREPGTS